MELFACLPLQLLFLLAKVAQCQEVTEEKRKEAVYYVVTTVLLISSNTVNHSATIYSASPDNWLQQHHSHLSTRRAHLKFKGIELYYRSEYI